MPSNNLKNMVHKTTKTENDIRHKLEKVVVNVGVGRLSQIAGFEEKGLVQVMKDVSMMTGQKPQVARAKKSVAGFKIREGQIVGVRVTLRGKKMVDFFERFIRIVLPRVHDFRGLSQDSVDKGGVLNVGLREQFVFPELSPEESPLTFPFGVNIVPHIKNKEKAMEMYRVMGVPFMRENEAVRGKKRRKKKDN